MDKDELIRYIGVDKISLIEAMEKIDQNARGIIYIVDEKGHLRGSLTDGDIRRWILKTGRLDGNVSQAMYKNTKYLFQTDPADRLEYVKLSNIHSIPIVNSDLEIIDVYFDDEELKKDDACDSVLEQTPIIIMAGGKGIRLYPYTKILPKPLIPIGDIPILERIFTHFYQYGAREFFLTVNYKKEMIKSYFTELEPPYTINYVEEKKMLGTAGGIRYIKRKFNKPVIVTNCDTLINVDFKQLLDYHTKANNDMTIVSSLKNTIIPYGVLHSKEQGIITAIEEKPQMSYFINTGMYIVNPEHLDMIPEDTMFHMTDLADKMMKSQKQVGMYPISENSFWDMGEFGEMKKMEERISNTEAIN